MGHFATPSVKEGISVTLSLKKDCFIFNHVYVIGMSTYVQASSKARRGSQIPGIGSDRWL